MLCFSHSRPCRPFSDEPFNHMVKAVLNRYLVGNDKNKFAKRKRKQNLN